MDDAFFLFSFLFFYPVHWAVMGRREWERGGKRKPGMEKRISPSKQESEKERITEAKDKRRLKAMERRSSSWGRGVVNMEKKREREIMGGEEEKKRKWERERDSQYGGLRGVCGQQGECYRTLTIPQLTWYFSIVHISSTYSLLLFVITINYTNIPFNSRLIFCIIFSPGQHQLPWSFFYVVRWAASSSSLFGNPPIARSNTLPSVQILASNTVDVILIVLQ